MSLEPESDVSNLSNPFKGKGVVDYSHYEAKSHRKLAKLGVATGKVGGAERKVGGATAPPTV